MDSKRSNNPSDPWSFDPFNPSRTPVNYDPMRRHRQRTDIPDRADIYAIQEDLNRGLKRLGEITIEDDATREQIEKAIAPIRSGYKILVRYLTEHGGTGEAQEVLHNGDV